MYVYSAADRSFFDLTQYPVMPWVVQDFTSDTLGKVRHCSSLIPTTEVLTICLNLKISS